LVLQESADFCLDRLMVAYYYREKLVQKCIKNAKFYGQYFILQDLSGVLAQLLEENIVERKEDIFLTSVPMYFLKKWKRGYNQSEILAKNIFTSSGVKYIPLMRKIRSHTPQSHLQKTDRLKNVRNSFILKKKYLSSLPGKTVILVDDVVSTGATLHEIAYILKRAGCEKVYGLCIASN